MGSKRVCINFNNVFLVSFNVSYISFIFIGNFVFKFLVYFIFHVLIPNFRFNLCFHSVLIFFNRKKFPPWLNPPSNFGILMPFCYCYYGVGLTFTLCIYGSICNMFLHPCITKTKISLLLTKWSSCIASLLEGLESSPEVLISPMKSFTDI